MTEQEKKIVDEDAAMQDVEPGEKAEEEVSPGSEEDIETDEKTEGNHSEEENHSEEGNHSEEEANSGEEDRSEEENNSEEGNHSGEEANSGEEDPKTRAEKRAAKKQAKHDKKAEAYREQIEHLEDRVKRQLAEFENFRNRSEKEKHAMFETGAKSVIEKMLPIVDNFERGLATVPEENREDPFVDGMSRVYKQLLTELENIGVKPIEAVGQEFDPNLHNAVMQVASEEYESGIVAQELQKGYIYHDLVVRHSMVAVTE